MNSLNLMNSPDTVGKPIYNAFMFLSIYSAQMLVAEMQQASVCVSGHCIYCSCDKSGFAGRNHTQ